MMSLSFGDILLILFGIASISLNKQLAQIIRESKKSIYRKEQEEIWSFRFPLYLVGTIFLLLGLARLLR